MRAPGVAAIVALIFVACNRGKYDDSFPAPGDPEALSVIWEGDQVAGSSPSVVYHDDTWHLYFTAKEGSFVGPVHAISEDGASFSLVSGHRIITGATVDANERVDSARVWNSGSTWHVLASTEVDGASTVVYARGTDGDAFDIVSLPFAADAEPAAGQPLSYAVTSADYEPGYSRVYMEMKIKGDTSQNGCWVTTSEDGGDTWAEPELALTADDVPEPWTSKTVGAGGLWDYSVVPAPDGGYHMLFVGAGPNGTTGNGIGHAFSEDGLVWTVDADPWRPDDDGQDISGLALVDEEDGYWLYYATYAEGDALPGGGALMRMWLGLTE